MVPYSEILEGTAGYIAPEKYQLPGVPVPFEILQKADVCAFATTTLEIFGVKPLYDAAIDQSWDVMYADAEAKKGAPLSKEELSQLLLDIYREYLDDPDTFCRNYLPPFQSEIDYLKSQLDKILQDAAGSYHADTGRDIPQDKIDQILERILYWYGDAMKRDSNERMSLDVAEKIMAEISKEIKDLFAYPAQKPLPAPPVKPLPTPPGVAKPLPTPPGVAKPLPTPPGVAKPLPTPPGVVALQPFTKPKPKGMGDIMRSLLSGEKLTEQDRSKHKVRDRLTLAFLTASAGLMIGGPVGAAVGAAVGGVVGGFEPTIIQRMRNELAEIFDEYVLTFDDPNLSGKFNSHLVQFIASNLEDIKKQGVDNFLTGMKLDKANMQYKNFMKEFQKECDKALKSEISEQQAPEQSAGPTESSGPTE
jgi:hypothetical protein